MFDISINMKEIQWHNGALVYLPQGTDLLQTVVNKVMNFLLPRNTKFFKYLGNYMLLKKGSAAYSALLIYVSQSVSQLVSQSVS